VTPRTRAGRVAGTRGTGTRTSRNDEVQQRIKQLILERGLRAGELMPTEFELVEELDVSRSSVREAVKALQAVGIVDIRHGYGMYVGRMSLGALVDELTFHGRLAGRSGRGDLMNLVEIREVLERGLVEELIDRASATPSAELDEVMAAMEAEAAAGEVTAQTDRRFHELLYQPMGNPLVNQLLSAFWDVYHTLQHDLEPAREAADSVAQRHRDIYEAMRGLDRKAATAAMRRHFEGIRARVEKSSAG
jgi:DNA-binding FadR family transcriptional regulator